MALTEKQIKALCVRKDQTGHWTHLGACLNMYEFELMESEPLVAICALQKNHKRACFDVMYGEFPQVQLPLAAAQWCHCCNISPCECAGYASL